MGGTLEDRGRESDLERGAVLPEVVGGEVARVVPVAIAEHDLGGAAHLVAHAGLASTEEVDLAERGVVEARAEEPDRRGDAAAEVTLELEARVGLDETAALEVGAPVLARAERRHETT